MPCNQFLRVQHQCRILQGPVRLSIAANSVNSRAFATKLAACNGMLDTVAACDTRPVRLCSASQPTTLRKTLDLCLSALIRLSLHGTTQA